MALLHLELRDSVAHQAADAVGPLEDGHRVTGASELLSRGETRRPRSDDGHRLARLTRRRLRDHPAFGPRPLDDLDLDLLDGHGVGVDAEHTCRLARSRTEASGELREVVGRVQAIERVPPVLSPDQVVPLGDEVSEGAPVVAERDAAVHASTGLLLEVLTREVLVDLTPVLDAYVDRTPHRRLARCRQKALGVSHGMPPSRRARDRAPRGRQRPRPRALAHSRGA